MTDQKLTSEEIRQILDKAMVAIENGDDEERNRLGRLLPLGPCLAKGVRDIYGKECAQGFNLSLANEKFGEGWLDKEDPFGPNWM